MPTGAPAHPLEQPQKEVSPGIVAVQSNSWTPQQLQSTLHSSDSCSSSASESPRKRHANAAQQLLCSIRKRRWEVISTTVSLIAAIFLLNRHLRKQQQDDGDGQASKGQSSALKSRDGAYRRGARIPLKEVVRFRERQWFAEDLENSRDGDPSAMLRVAKMYLHGQGCNPDPAMAQEWLRRARQLGIVCSLDELYAGDDLPGDAVRQRMLQNSQRQQPHRQEQQLVGRGSLPAARRTQVQSTAPQKSTN